jgi:ABC-type phosphate transport system substrate-binding protein
MSNANMLVLTLASLCCTQAMAAVVGGGAAPTLYNTVGVTPAGFSSYIDIGSGDAKVAVLTNNAASLGLPAGTTVDYAGSDSVLSATELAAYKAAHQSPAVATSSPANWGPLIQVPSAITSVTVPYKKAGISNLNLTSAQLCGIFAGTITDWSAISSASGPITVVYRRGSSGISEIFTRHLNSQCPIQIGVSSTFTSAVVGGVKANFVGAYNHAQSVSVIVNATEGAIGYEGPEHIDATNNAVVARVNGKLPIVGNVTTELSNFVPPALADRDNPAYWGPTLPNPTSGYSIVGYTYLIFSQCYKDAADNTAVRNFINRYFNSVPVLNSDAAIIAQKLIPLTPKWKVAIRDTFWGTSSSLAVGNTTACNSIGRPL